MPILQNSKNIGVWGFGKEGQAALQYLIEEYPFARKTILDDTGVPVEASVPGGVDVVQGEVNVSAAVRSGRFDAIIKSPGVSLYREDIGEAKERGTRFTSGTNLWFEQKPDISKIVVTGTKGKSTTAKLLYHLLSGLGYNVSLLGNIGTPLLSRRRRAKDISDSRETTPIHDDHIIIELSSYQIADLEFAPQFAIITNLFVEHTPWHGSVEQYFNDKLRILRLSEGTVGICNRASDTLRGRLTGRDNILWYNSMDGFYVQDGRLYFRGTEVECSSFPLKGEHNLSNLAAACTLCDALKSTGVRTAVNLANFQSLPHRMEEFACGNLICVDDSIATIPEATIASLTVYADKRVVLFLGGAERGQDYTELSDLLEKKNIAMVVLLPVTGHRIYRDLLERKYSFPVLLANNLEHGVEEAFSLAAKADVLLLSPGAPSFGHFRNFEERGAQFKLFCSSCFARDMRRA